MMIAPCLLKRRAVAARHGEADILEVEHSAVTSRILRIAQTDAPRPAVGIVADQSDLAEIGVDMCESPLAQHVGDAVGDKTLADRIQRDAHPRTPKGYSVRVDVKQTIVDKPFRHPTRRGVDIA